jgi:uncharacterized protein (TIGR02271 family)
MADMRETGLVSLDHDEWAVADGEPDVRGWDVFTTDQRRIGEVDDLLADPAAMKVRYMTIDLDNDTSGNRTDKVVRIPIERTRIDEGEHRVVVDFASGNVHDLASAPAQPWKEDQVRLTRSAEELRIGKRQVKGGEVEVTKRVETDRVRENVRLRSEEVDVERRPVTGAAATGDVQISAREIRVPIYEEEAVVEKRPVIKEEVVISKRPVEKTETVEADVREEHIDVDRHADVRGTDRDRTRGRGEE